MQENETQQPSANSTTNHDSLVPNHEDIPPEILKRAFKAFKKRLKLTALDEDSRLGGGAFSKGSAKLTAIQPPNQYPREVWHALHRQGKIRDVGHGLYELPKSDRR